MRHMLKPDVFYSFFFGFHSLRSHYFFHRSSVVDYPRYEMDFLGQAVLRLCILILHPLRHAFSGPVRVCWWGIIVCMQAV